MRPLASCLALLLALATTAPAFAADRGVTQAPDTLRDAALAPLEDLNLKQTAIPDVLVRAKADPYALKDLKTCEAIAAEVGRLDEALGPDLDEAPPPDGRTRLEKAGSAVKAAGVAEVRDRSGDLLPFRGWVRKLTGAARHEKAVKAAIEAGKVRRGYLKGTGMRMNCAPPAAPSWFTPVKAKPPVERARGWLETLWTRLLAWVRSVWPF